ncbi:SCP-like protein [Ancylostoma caninum]|uniref:SCP-like protein n=1 Tax=Ancylostoma caninum TaxID=29170 RepID=A0A368GUM3_ANCCA|nr:SCP-like protein [Ancylostoma caninum]
MLPFLFIILFINGAFSTDPYKACENGEPDVNDAIRKGALDIHNEFRVNLTKKLLLQDNGEALPGSKSMFKLTYDCALEGLAMTTLSGCQSKPKMDYIPAGKSLNYAIVRNVAPLPADAAIAEMIKATAEEWAETRYDDIIDEKTVTYNNTDLEPFANMIYHKTMTVGCGTMYCSGPKNRLAIACVYDAKPELGQPLYTPAKADKGCNDNDKPCTKAVKGSTCILANDPTFAAYKGLCKATNYFTLPIC